MPGRRDERRGCTSANVISLYVYRFPIPRLTKPEFAHILSTFAVVLRETKSAALATFREIFA